uniref:Uncharacterized protein n=1 Tax=Arundo donax TaxID=35708 RepID=A0A0A9BVQ0_ARUDO
MLSTLFLFGLCQITGGGGPGGPWNTLSPAHQPFTVKKKKNFHEGD